MEYRDVIPLLLKDADPTLRLYGVIWVGEERIAEHREAIEKLLQNNASNRQLFEASLACLDRLAMGPSRDFRAESAGEVFTAKLLRNPTTNCRSTAICDPFAAGGPSDAYRMELLTKLLADADPAMRLEAIRTLRQRPEGAWWPAYGEMA